MGIFDALFGRTKPSRWLPSPPSLGQEPSPAKRPQAAAEPFVVDFVAVDVETSCSSVASICQIGIVGFAGGQIVMEYQSLLDPKHPFDDFNVDLHGIDARKVRGSPCFRKALPIIERHLSGRPTVAHSSFDRRAIAAAAAFHRVKAPDAIWHDSVAIARRVWPDLPSHRLNELTARFGIQLDHHDALSDAKAAGLIVVRAMSETGLTLKELVARQPKPSKRRTLNPAGDGPLIGHVVVLTGEMSVPRATLAARLAEAGAKVAANVGPKTTMLVVGQQDPTKVADGQRSTKEHAAAARIAQGQPIEILDEVSLLARLG